MKQKPTIVKVNSAPLKIVGDGARWNVDTVQGRAVPVLIVDGGERDDIRDLFILHRDLGRYGEASHQWLIGHGPAILGRKPRAPVILRLNYLNPVTTQLDIEFAVPKQAILIEMVLKAECFYLQSGKSGDRTSDDAPRILVEALSVGFEPVWRKMHLALIEAQLKNVRGLRWRAKRREIAEELIAEMGQLSDVRIASKEDGT